MDICPLPIDWLDYLDGEVDAGRSGHLERCLSCQATVATLRAIPAPSVVQPDLAAPTPSTRRWAELSWRAPEFGDIWLAKASIPSGSDTYRSEHRVPLLVLGPKNRSNRQDEWLDVVPVWTDADNAHGTDLLLYEEDTSLGCMLRTLFRLQTPVRPGHLDSRVGQLTESGRRAIDAALQGRVDSQRLGLPLQGEFDVRLQRDEWLSTASAHLKGLYGAEVARKEAEAALISPAEQAAEGTLPDETAQRRKALVRFVLERGHRAVDTSQPLALAASSRLAKKRTRAYLETSIGTRKVRVEGILRLELIPDDRLVFEVTDVMGINEPIVLVVTIEGRSASVSSPPFVPRAGLKATLTQGAGALLDDVKQLELVLA